MTVRPTSNSLKAEQPITNRLSTMTTEKQRTEKRWHEHDVLPHVDGCSDWFEICPSAYGGVLIYVCLWGEHNLLQSHLRWRCRCQVSWREAAWGARLQNNKLHTNQHWLLDWVVCAYHYVDEDLNRLNLSLAQLINFHPTSASVWQTETVSIDRKLQHHRLSLITYSPVWRKHRKPLQNVLTAFEKSFFLTTQQNRK